MTMVGFKTYLSPNLACGTRRPLLVIAVVLRTFMKDWLYLIFQHYSDFRLAKLFKTYNQLFYEMYLPSIRPQSAFILDAFHHSLILDKKTEQHYVVWARVVAFRTCILVLCGSVGYRTRSFPADKQNTLHILTAPNRRMRRARTKSANIRLAVVALQFTHSPAMYAKHKHMGMGVGHAQPASRYNKHSICSICANNACHI